MKRIGVFGGSFDPPHMAHLRVAKAACEELVLDTLLWIPAATPPHKAASDLTDVHHRVEMTRLMTREDDRFTLDTIEVDRPGLSFTVDTLRSLHQREMDALFFLVIGQDQWSAFSTWREADAIRELATVAGYRRPGSKQGADENIRWLEGSEMDISSTDIRRAIRAGSVQKDTILPSVVRYIQENGLYLAD